MSAMAQKDRLAAAQPHWHLDDELLLQYAAGSLDDATSLIVATHLTYCPICREKAREMEAVGGALIESLSANDTASVAMSDGALSSILARLNEANDDQDPAPQPLAAVSNPILPRPIQRLIGGDMEAATWKRLGMGVETAELPLGEDGKRSFLLKVPAGRAVPQHTHDGNEYVVILDGAYNDELGRFARGDVAISDHEIDHRPIAEEGRDCICLVVVDGPVRLTGPLGGVLNYFVKL